MLCFFSFPFSFPFFFLFFFSLFSRNHHTFPATLFVSFLQSLFFFLFYIPFHLISPTIIPPPPHTHARIRCSPVGSSTLHLFHRDIISFPFVLFLDPPNPRFRLLLLLFFTFAFAFAFFFCQRRYPYILLCCCFNWFYFFCFLCPFYFSAPPSTPELIQTQDLDLYVPTLLLVYLFWVLPFGRTLSCLLFSVFSL